MPYATGSPLTDLDAVYLREAFNDREIKRALNAWRQGDLVKGVGLYWAGTPDHDPITGLAMPPSAGHQWPVVPWDGVPAVSQDSTVPFEIDVPDPAETPVWSIITSQTCDVVATGPGQKHPTVQVSPLLNLDHLGNGRITEIRRHSNVELVYVPAVPVDGNWAADLRISLPVSKAVLLQQERVHGFSTAGEAQQFGERVAAKYRRPALHDQISGELVTNLRALVKSSREAGEEWPDLIEQFRLLVTDGDKLTPRHVVILALTFSDSLSPEDRMPLREWHEREAKRLRRATDGMELGPFRFFTVDSVPVRDYRDSDWLRIPELGQRVFW